jgi:hypothetical protein
MISNIMHDAAAFLVTTGHDSSSDVLRHLHVTVEHSAGSQ